MGPPQRVLYHITHEENLYASRFIARGYRDAFRSLGHTCEFVSIRDHVLDHIRTFKPDLLLTSVYLLPWLRSRGGLRKLDDERRRGMVVAALTPPWETYGKKIHSLRYRWDVVRLARSGTFPDFFYCTASDRSLDDVRRGTDCLCVSVPEAANKLIHFPDKPATRFGCDAVYLGHNLRYKKSTFQEYLRPAQQRFDVRVIGRDWSWTDRRLGLLQSVSQIVGIRAFDRLRSLPNTEAEERQIYASAKICLNLHNPHQHNDGYSCNSRTFVVAACGGFQISDNVAQIRDFFTDEEVVVARDARDWMEAIAYYLSHENERSAMAKRARQNALTNHTYHNRAATLLAAAEEVRRSRGTTNASAS